MPEIRTREEFLKVMDENRLWGGWMLALEDGSMSGAESYQEQKDTAETYKERFPDWAEEIIKEAELVKNAEEKSV
ncbi:hypothetical protein [Methanococcus maripaludis]|uniref:Uncharacterized protein n=1 Tax=Methanococcus maripaludis TaxID=39152 RepID=A0A2L1CB30_METMI|nr:hypothetical protein [Methanococcus maripaludis]AVB76096.1 hypothetical protein MMJJ_06820 [Methanococcus maripaludis]